MLERTAQLFGDMGTMIRCPRKALYEQKMNFFLTENQWFLEEVCEYMEQSEDKEKAAKEVAVNFTGQVFSAFSKKNKIKSYVQADLNMYMVYYVFPAILKTDRSYAEPLVQEICSEWGRCFKDSKIRYASYEEIYNSINEKILGIF